MEEGKASRHLPSLAAMAAIGLSSVAAILTLVFAVLVAYVAMYDAPFWDMWQHVNRDTLLKDLFVRHNEHPVAIDRLLFWIDDALFSASSRFVQIVAHIGLAAQVVLFVWLAKLAGVARPILAVGPVAAVFVFYPFGFENTIWIFQVMVVLAFTCALGAFVCFAAYVQQGSRSGLVGSIVLSIIPVLSFANGVFVPTFLVAMALWLRRSAVLPFVLIAIAAWAWQLASPIMGGGKAFSLESLGGIIAHFLTQLGAPVGFAAGYASRIGMPVVNNVHIALQAGVVVAILSGLALASIWMRARRNPAAIATAATLLFALATAALIAVSRHTAGVEQALSSRYNLNAALIYVTVLIVALMAAGATDARTRGRVGWVAPVLSGLLVILSATSVLIFKDLGGRYRAALEGTTALVAGAPDPGSIGQLSFDMSMAQREAEEFRKHRTWMFVAPMTLRVGKRLTEQEVATPACTKAKTTISDPDPHWNFRKAKGTLLRQQASAGAAHVLITDGNGTVSGYGRVPRRASDLNPFVQQDGSVIDWVGRIRPDSTPPYIAWLADDRAIRCRLGAPSSG